MACVNQQAMNYADIYTIAMQYFAPKREALAGILAQRIGADVVAAHKSVSLVDAGAGDGTMMADTLDRIDPQARQAIDTTYLEPDESNFVELHRNFNRLSGLTHGAVIENKNLETYIAYGNAGPIDVVAMTHMLYHVPREAWKPFLTDTFNGVAPKGAAYITLIDADSDVYKLSGLDTEHEAGVKENGGYVFSHHLEAVLRDMPGVGYEKIQSTGTYAIPQGDIEEFQNAPDAAALAETKLAAFLGFVLRLKPGDIAANEKMVENFRTHFRQGLPLRSTETIFRAVHAPAPK
jgi:hypothetical protein